MKTVTTSKASLLTVLGLARTLIFILILVGLFLAQRMQAVNPPPDGGYPGGNTAEGQGALLNLSSGTFNTAVGLLSLNSNTEGQFNTAIGAGTLFTNTADKNTGIGAGALLSNTNGIENTATGSFALLNNSTGTQNAAFGANALINSTTGGGNTAVGFNALPNNSTGITNTALGFNAGFAITTADNVIVIGTNVAGQNVDHSCFIGEIFGETAPSALPWECRTPLGDPLLPEVNMMTSGSAGVTVSAMASMTRRAPALTGALSSSSIDQTRCNAGSSDRRTLLTSSR